MRTDKTHTAGNRENTIVVSNPAKLQGLTVSTHEGEKIGKVAQVGVLAHNVDNGVCARRADGSPEGQPPTAQVARGDGATASAGQESLAVTLAGRMPGRRHGAAVWLVRREPAGLLRVPRDLARRCRGLVLFGAALAGVITGCLTRDVTGGRRQAGEVPPPPKGPPGQSRNDKRPLVP